MEACAIMGHWSTLPASADPGGLPRLHLFPGGTSHLIVGVRSDPFGLPAELRGRPRDTFPASFFRRSQRTATAFDAAVAIFLALRAAETALPLGIILSRLMTAVSGVALLPSAFPGIVRGRQGAERTIRPLAHRLCRLVMDAPDGAVSMHDALHSVLYLPAAEFHGLTGAPPPLGSPAYSDGHSSLMSDSEDDRFGLPSGEAVTDRVLGALFRTEAGLVEALAEPPTLNGHARLTRLERITTRLGDWVRGCAELAEARATADPE